MKNETFVLLFAVGVVAAVVLASRAASAVGGFAGDVVDAVNPASTENIVYRAINAVGDVYDNGSDDDSFSLGAWLWEVTHPAEVAAGY